MGTRGALYIMDDDGSTLVHIYRQSDGYPEANGMGGDLARICNVRLVNGYQGGATTKTQANGMGCLAAKIIMGLKDGVYSKEYNPGRTGGIYIAPLNERPEDTDSAYVWFVRPNGTEVLI
jgi:hypothetical protein